MPMTCCCTDPFVLCLTAGRNQRASEWVDAECLQFNTQKCKFMRVSRKERYNVRSCIHCQGITSQLNWYGEHLRVTGAAMLVAVAFSIFPDIRSWSLALEASMFCKRLITSSPVHNRFFLGYLQLIQVFSWLIMARQVWWWLLKHVEK